MVWRHGVLQVRRNLREGWLFPSERHLCTRHCQTVCGYTVVGFLPKVGENHEGQVLDGGLEGESSSCVSSAPPLVCARLKGGAFVHGVLANTHRVGLQIGRAHV